MKNSYHYFENKDCEFYHCHKGMEEINCLFCYCPLYNLEKCPGNYEYKYKEGQKIKVCTNCIFPHKAENYSKVIQILKKNIKRKIKSDSNSVK